MGEVEGGALSDRAPFVRGSDTSEDAARQIRPHAGRMAERVFEFVQAKGERGATVDEVEVELEMLHQTAGARVRELVLAGRLVDSENRRRTRTGRYGAVWILTELKAKPAPPPPRGGYGPLFREVS